MGTHQGLDVAVAPLLEEAGVAVLALGVDPHVERLGHDHHAQRVANLHLHLARHVVRCTDGIAAHVFHGLHLADEGGLVDGSTQRPEVVVQADALQFARLAIQLEAAFARHCDGANAHFFLDFIDGFAIFHQLHAQGVEVRRLRSPEQRAGHFERGAGLAASVDIVVGGHHHLALPVEQADLDGARRASRLCADLHLGPVALDAECAEEGAPAVNAPVACQHQCHGAVDACAGIPAGTFLDILQVYLQHVLTAVQEGRGINPESVVAVGPVASLAAVDLHGRLGHGTVEHQLGMLVAGGHAERGLVVSLANPG